MQGSGVRLASLTAQIASTAPSAAQLTPATSTAIVAAWWQLRRGLSAAALPVVDDTAAAIDALGAWRRRAAALERLAAHRPAGWPTSGAAMLFTLAVIRDLPPGTLALGEAADELLALMHGDQRSGGRPVAKLGSHLPPQVPAGYEGIATMRQRLTEQLAAAGDSIDAYPTLAAAERAAIDHENSGRLRLGAPEDWDAPWNRGKQQPTLWPAPSTQRSWRHRLLPPLPRDFAPAPSTIDPLAEPATYTAAIARIRATTPGTKVTRQLAEDLVHAFHAERYGVGAIAKRDWRPRPKGGLAEIQAVVDAYEAHGDLRPVGWPASGLAAILLTATWRDPGSYEHSGAPVRLRRPEHVPMALGLLRLVTDGMERLAKREKEIAAAKKRRRGRGGRSPEHRDRKAAKHAAQAGPLRMHFRIPGATHVPHLETPSQTYERIRRQLLAIGHHPADYPSLEDAELALIDLETAGQLPTDIGPSPSASREARFALARSTGPAAIAAAEWDHLAAAASQLLTAGDARRLADVEAVSIQDGRLILTGSAETLEWAKAAHLLRLLEHVARQLDVAHSATLIAAEHAAVFRPTAELRGPADNRAARADRYADERLHRFAVEDRS